VTSGPEQSQGGAPQDAAAPAPGGETTQEQPMTEQEQAQEPEAPEGTEATTGTSGTSGMAEDSENDLVADLADAQAKVGALTDDLKRLQAEYVNYKRRVDRDRALVLENAKFSVLSAMLPVLDDLDRAREHGELEGGFKAVADALERIVSGQGLVKFGKPGDEFDPNFHEALMHAHSKDVTTTTCQQVVSAGYQIGDRVVRPAQVIVVDPEPEAPTAPAATGESGSDADDQ
jgi:molecular chaperone GrpE